MDNGLRQVSALASGPAHGGRARVQNVDSTLLEYWLILRPWSRCIAAVAIGSAIAVFVLTRFVMTQWYQASAVIRPASQVGPVSPLAGVVGSSLPSQALSNLFNGANSLSGAIPSDAAEFIDLSKGYGFTTDLIHSHHLGPMLDQKSVIQRMIAAVEELFSTPGPVDRNWGWYQAMQKRFDIEYDDKLGDLTLTFEDGDPVTARKILEFYIEELRSTLRERSIKDTEAVVDSLRTELNQTSDPLVQQQLAILLASEIQQEKTAKAEADFAFSVTDAPYVPDEVYAPKPTLWAVAACVLVPFVMCAWLIFIERVWRLLRAAEGAVEVARANGAAAPISLEIAQTEETDAQRGREAL